jgi:hypothetical protein
MQINENCNYVLKDIYLYDIESCHFQILKKMGLDMSFIPDKTNKLERNKSIGLLFRDKPKLSQKVRDVTNSTIREYLKINDVQPNELILRQYDGIMVVRKIHNIDQFIDLPLKEKFDIFIISIDKQKYIALTSEKVTIKGMSNIYPGIEKYYKRLLQINFISYQAIFKTLQKIKHSLLNSNDTWDFAIPISNNKYKIHFKSYGELDVSMTMINLIEVEEIDRNKYFELYLKPFTKSITYDYI